MTDADGHLAEHIDKRRQPFGRVTDPLARWVGSPSAALIVAGAAAVWVVAGIVTDFPRAWELCATAGIPLLTLGLLIVIQHTQNHDDQAMQLKLDELIRSVEGTTNAMMRVEEAGTDELEELQKHFRGDSDATVAEKRDA